MSSEVAHAVMFRINNKNVPAIIHEAELSLRLYIDVMSLVLL